MAVDGAGHFGCGEFGAAGLGEFGVEDELVAGADGFAEFDFIGAHEERGFALTGSAAEHENARGLRHGFELEDARHDGVVGEMTLKIRLVDADVLDGDEGSFAEELHDPVDHDERVTVREGVEDAADIERGLIGHDHRRTGFFLRAFLPFG